MNRQCPDCKVELTAIDLVIANPHGGDGWLLYGVGERTQETGFLGIKVQRAQPRGRVTGMACPRCARVLLFAVPRAD